MSEQKEKLPPLELKEQGKPAFRVKTRCYCGDILDQIDALDVKNLEDINEIKLKYPGLREHWNRQIEVEEYNKQEVFEAAKAERSPVLMPMQSLSDELEITQRRFRSDVRQVNAMYYRAFIQIIIDKDDLVKDRVALVEEQVDSEFWRRQDLKLLTDHALGFREENNF